MKKITREQLCELKSLLRQVDREMEPVKELSYHQAAERIDELESLLRFGGRIIDETPKKRIYIAGKMNGLKNYGYQKFYDKAAELTATGKWETINPADYPYEGVNASFNGKGKITIEVDENELSDFTYHKVLYRDFILIEEADAIYMMAGWEKSPGASCELAYAKLRGKEIVYGVPGDGNKARTRPYRT